MSAPSHPAARGFYVFQAAIGTPLQFHPALGTSELDSLMDAYLPSPASIQDKRASISVDFFDHFRLTGESIKFYQVPDWVTSTTSSPNSAQDSGYGSSFAASPLAPTWSWGPLDTTASTPSTSSSVSTPQIPSRRRKQSSCSRQSTSSRASATDFSNLPGMKILTKDGRDVTNTATRGCKTKEQRDHAHLMRIMKACDACKKKKVRCDPSHRARASPVSPAEHPARTAKKARISCTQSKPEMSVPAFEPAISENPTSLSSLPDSFEFDTFDFLNETPVDEQASWDEFLKFNGDLDSVFPDGLGNLPDLDPLTSVPPRPVLSAYSDPSVAPAVLCQEDTAVRDVAKLPYMEENDEPHHYVDFNLYSPSSSISDSEPSVLPDMLDSRSRSEAAKWQAGGVGVNERVAMSTVHRPEGYPDTRTPDYSQSPSCRVQQAWTSSDSAAASVDQYTVRFPRHSVCRRWLTMTQDLGVQIPASSPLSPQRERLLSKTIGSLNTKTIDGQAPREEGTWSPDLRIGRPAQESKASNEANVVSDRFSAAPPGVSSRSKSIATTRQGDATAAAFATQATAADLRRPGRDVASQSAPSVDERGSCVVIESHPACRAQTEPYVSRTTETKFGVPKPAATPAMESSGVEQPRLENRDSVTVAIERETLSGQATSASVFMSSRKSACTSVPGDLSVAQNVPPSCQNPTGTDCSATTQQQASPVSPYNLLPTATAVVDLAVTAALNCVATSSASPGMVPGASTNTMWAALCAMAHTTSRQAQNTGGSGSSVRLRTGHAVSRVETALSRVPVLV